MLIFLELSAIIKAKMLDAVINSIGGIGIMRIYDSLIIGSGYTALGYALATPGTVIVEERQICDTGFYLPLVGYSHGGIMPKTEYGRQLYEYYASLGLIDSHMQNLNGFESAFCAFALEKKQEILLKTRVISINEREDSISDIRLITPSGIIHILAKRVIDMRSVGKPAGLTLLFSSSDAERDLPAVARANPGAEIEQAFFADRYALRLPVRSDYLSTKAMAYKAWEKVECAARLIYTAPVFSTTPIASSEVPTDNCFKNPIDALDAGVLYAGAVKRK